MIPQTIVGCGLEIKEVLKPKGEGTKIKIRDVSNWIQDQTSIEYFFPYAQEKRLELALFCFEFSFSQNAAYPY